MDVAASVEVLYLTIVGILAAFAAAFYVITKRPRKDAKPEAEAPPEPRMEKSEKRWLYIIFLIIVIGNLVTLSPLIPATNQSLYDTTPPAKTVAVSIKDYAFTLPENPITVPRGKVVEFSVISYDVTYGFGVFRDDGSMVFQMQVVPVPYTNTLRWVFDEVGAYDIRSTEYSGPPHSTMHLVDALVVVEVPP